MTPGARVAAAIEILHDMDEGLAAEQALTRWARRSRFAGSKDRAAIRDHIFDVLRCQLTAAHYGKSNTPRALLVGLLHMQGTDLQALFSGEGHAPAPLNEAEQVFPDAPTDKVTRWNLPEWILPQIEACLGAKAEPTALLLQTRAPVVLRINSAKTDRATAQKLLAQEGVETENNTLCDTALTVTEGARKVRNSTVYQNGLVELQDAASQAVAAKVPQGSRVLDYCAGGGGKALALAASADRHVFAHDIDARRMADLPARAARAGVQIPQIDTDDLPAQAPFDVVVCDAPCSGSGAWRRAAEGKWTLSAGRLQELSEIQDRILDDAIALTATDGILVYATCSILSVENEDRVTAFLERNQGWKSTYQERIDVSAQGDGFFTAHLKRDT